MSCVFQMPLMLRFLNYFNSILPDRVYIIFIVSILILKLLGEQYIFQFPFSKFLLVETPLQDFFTLYITISQKIVCLLCPKNRRYWENCCNNKSCMNVSYSWSRHQLRPKTDLVRLNKRKNASLEIYMQFEHNLWKIKNKCFPRLISLRLFWKKKLCPNWDISV